MNDTRIEVCGAGDIEKEDVIRFDHKGRTFAIYRTVDDTYYATDGLCTPAQVHLSGGFIMGHIIEFMSCTPAYYQVDFSPPTEVSFPRKRREA